MVLSKGFKHLLIAFFIIGLGLLGACQKDILIKPNGAVESIGLRGSSPIVDSGRLVFTTSHQLAVYLDDFKNRPFSEFTQAIIALENNGFSSAMVQDPTIQQEKFQRFYGNSQTIVDIDEDSLIHDTYFASILNESYEVIVGDTLYKYTEKGVFFTDPSNYNQLIAIIDNYQIGTEVGLTEIGEGYFRYVPDESNGDIPIFADVHELPSDPPPPPSTEWRWFWTGL